MKLVVAPVASLLSLLVGASSCDDGKAPPQRGEVGAGRDAKAEGDAKAGVDAKAGADAKAGSIADAVADAKAADAKAVDPAADAKAPAADAKAVDPAGGADPKATAKPGVEVSALYWAESNTDKGKTTVDITDPPDAESLFKLAYELGESDGFEATYPPDKLPAGFAIGDEWVVATTTSEARGKAVAYGAYSGASEGHFIVVLDTLATGLTARASAWTGPIPKLRDAKPIDMKKGPGKALFEAIKGPMAAAAVDPPAKAALGRKPIAVKHVTAIEGRFPNGFTHLVTLTRPIAPAEEIGTEHVGGLFLADATGRVEAIFPPAMTINSDEFLFLVDLEGDGVDEVIYDDSYYEGSYRLLMTWNPAGKAEQRTLTGDGA